MIPGYKDITVVTNSRRTEKLVEFNNLAVEYFNNLRLEGFERALNENPAATGARQKINLDIELYSQIIRAADVQSEYIYQDAPARGGRVSTVDLVHNIFLLAPRQIDPRLLFDMINRAIGVYKRNHTAALIRTFNPLWWVGRLFSWFSYIPIWVLAFFGFNEEKLAASPLGKLLRGAVWLAGFALVVLQIDQLLGSKLAIAIKEALGIAS